MGMKKFKYTPEKDYIGEWELSVRGWTGNADMRRTDVSENSITLKFVVRM